MDWPQTRRLTYGFFTQTRGPLSDLLLEGTSLFNQGDSFSDEQAALALIVHEAGSDAGVIVSEAESLVEAEEAASREITPDNSWWAVMNSPGLDVSSKMSGVPSKNDIIYIALLKKQDS